MIQVNLYEDRKIEILDESDSPLCIINFVALGIELGKRGISRKLLTQKEGSVEKHIILLSDDIVALAESISFFMEKFI